MNPVGGRAIGVAGRLLERIVDGRYPPGSRLPTEPDLCGEMGVSRVTLREAVKSLQQRGVVSVEQGRGTFVNPEARWSPFDPVLLAARTAGPDGPDPEWAKKLLEVRRMVEVGVAGLAAERRDDTDLAAMRAQLDAMRDARRAADVRAFAEADLAFHDAVLAAAGNELIAALFDPISRLVHESRLATSRPADRQAHALRAHRSIYRSIAAADGAAASLAMQRHIDDTLGFVASTAAGASAPAGGRLVKAGS
jgi:GntR family transcriptional repressor for pyruvate dehydrogenase complex